MVLPLKLQVIILALAGLNWTAVSVSQIAPAQPSSTHEQRPATPSPPPAPNEASPGSINGTVLDQSGAAVSGAKVKLTGKDQILSPETTSGSDGQYFFSSVAAGPFQLTITSSGFAPQTVSGSLAAGEVKTMPPIALAVADTFTEIDVGNTQVEVAEQQIKVEEKQRILGAIPNFYVSYIPDAVALTTKQKYKLAFRTMVDPFTFGIAAAVAGIEQGQNHFAEYGPGAEGYGKRFGASLADGTTGTLLAGAVFPSLLKQDPRYFYKGTGSRTSRALYAIANSVICKGDNRRWQVNYSNILGNLAAGGISNLYYPEQDRSGAGLTFENAAIGIGATAIGNLFQEFFIKKLTPKASKQTAQP
ncbi:MAG: carboxypeptidase-like regulatory domain-containing protein [Terriglobales bacterium]